MRQIPAREGDLRTYVTRFLPRVSKPARYTGGEYNAVIKEAGEKRVRFALAFPDIYEVGMSNLGLRILYHALNSRADVAAERVFAPWVDMEAEMRAAGVPLYSLETGSPLRDFGVVGFSLAHELTYTNVLNMLDLAGIPVRASDRTDADPLIIAGGHCAFNPEPMAEFIDAFAIGDGEEIVLEIAEAVRDRRREGRDSLLTRLAAIPGIYVPSRYEAQYECGRFLGLRPKTDGLPGRIAKRTVADLESAFFPDRFVVPFVEAVHDRAAVEIARGCTRGCRFCHAGMVTRPVRQRSHRKLMEQAESLVSSTGYDEVALVSLSSADYDGIEDLVRTMVEHFEERRVGVSLPSLRADAECVALAGQIERVRKTGLTFAPEAGSQRLRDAVNKNVTEEELFAAISAALDHGWHRVKLYFMIGLPTETDDDLRAIGDLVRSVIGLARRKKTSLNVNVSVACFVPKPHTPFQWRAQGSVEELERKLGIVQEALSIRSVKLGWHNPQASVVECALARGDRRVGAAILRAWGLGAKFDGWEERFDFGRWQQAFADSGLEMAHYSTRSFGYDDSLPWDHIDVGLRKEFLIEQDRMADEARADPDCKLTGCKGCGLEEQDGPLCAEIRERRGSKVAVAS